MKDARDYEAALTVLHTGFPSLPRNLMQQNEEFFNENFEVIVSKTMDTDKKYMLGLTAKKGLNPKRLDSYQRKLAAFLIPGRIIKGPLTEDQDRMEKILYKVDGQFYIFQEMSEVHIERHQWIKEQGAFGTNPDLVFPPDHLSAEKKEAYLRGDVFLFNANDSAHLNHFMINHRSASCDKTLCTAVVCSNMIPFSNDRQHETTMFYSYTYGDLKLINTGIFVKRTEAPGMYSDEIDENDDEYINRKKLTKAEQSVAREARKAVRQERSKRLEQTSKFCKISEVPIEGELLHNFKKTVIFNILFKY